MEINGIKISTTGEDHMIKEGVVGFLMKSKGMTKEEASQIPIHIFVQQWLWTLAMNCGELPAEYKIKKPQPVDNKTKVLKKE